MFGTFLRVSRFRPTMEIEAERAFSRPVSADGSDQPSRSSRSLT
jgi:hypothetical protein